MFFNSINYVATRIETSHSFNFHTITIVFRSLTSAYAKQTHLCNNSPAPFHPSLAPSVKCMLRWCKKFSRFTKNETWVQLLLRHNWVGRGRQPKKYVFDDDVHMVTNVGVALAAVIVCHKKKNKCPSPAYHHHLKSWRDIIWAMWDKGHDRHTERGLNILWNWQ